MKGDFFKHEIFSGQAFEDEQQRALPVRGHAAKVDIVPWAEFLGEVFSDGNSVVLDENIVNGHVRDAGEHFVEDRRLGGLGVHLEQVHRAEFQPLEFGAEFFDPDNPTLTEFDFTHNTMEVIGEIFKKNLKPIIK